MRSTAENGAARGQHGGQSRPATVDQHKRRAIAEGHRGTTVGGAGGNVAVLRSDVVAAVEIRLAFLEDIEEVGRRAGLFNLSSTDHGNRIGRRIRRNRNQ